ncbi:hypothetical protein ADUPG1_013919, partial [Aduncisulcus paluster]
MKDLILAIEKTSSQYYVTSLYKESYPRLKTIFDENSSLSAITSNRDLFALCFECLSLFLEHNIKKGKDSTKIILEIYSIKNLVDSFLLPMIRIEDILRVKEAEEEAKGRACEDDVNTFTIALFRILNVTMRNLRKLRNKIFPQISTLLSEMLSLGRSMKFEDSFVEDILMTCRTIAFAKDNLTKDSLLSILLPHILPWMKKYPDKMFFLHWSNILKNLTLDEN